MFLKYENIEKKGVYPLYSKLQLKESPSKNMQ